MNEYGKVPEVFGTTAPEKSVVEDPPPEPDYPRYRAEPARGSLADVDPDETERYRKKKDVAGELEAQRERIGELQERLYAENERGLLIVLQATDTGGKDGRSSTSSPASTRRAAGSPFEAPSALVRFVSDSSKTFEVRFAEPRRIRGASYVGGAGREALRCSGTEACGT